MYTTKASTSADLEKEYSPSHWSKRFDDPEELIKYHIGTAKEESLRVSKIYNCAKDVKYGDSEREAMDIYFKTDEDGSPIFVYLHGGYWQLLSKNISAYSVAPLVERGYKVIIPDYNLCPNVTLEAIVEEIRKLIKKVYEYAVATKASHISFSGHSAGAHLIACVIDEITSNENSHLLKSFFLISGVYDLREIYDNKAVNDKNILTVDQYNCEKLSPMLYKGFKQSKAKFYILVGEYESEVFIKQSEAFADILKKSKLQVEFKIMEHLDHCDIVENLKNEKSESFKYIQEKDGFC